MAAIYSNGGNRWNILGFNFTKRDALSSVYKISMDGTRRDGMVWCGMYTVSCDTSWNGKGWYGMLAMLWYDMIFYGYPSCAMHGMEYNCKRWSGLMVYAVI
jgi:hypothetical protein